MGNLWDGVLSFVAQMAIKFGPNLPMHQSTGVLLFTVDLASGLALLYVLVGRFINLGPPMTVFVTIMTGEVARTLLAIWKFMKEINPLSN